MNVRAPLLLAPLVLALACLEPPEITPLPPPLADLGPLDTWGPLDGLPDPGDDPIPGDPSTTGGETQATDGETQDTGASELDPGLLDLRLTEVLADPDGKDGALDTPELVELLNTGDQPVKLAGLVLVSDGWPQLDAEELGLADTALGPDELLVIRRWTKDEPTTLTAVEHLDGVVWAGFLHGDGLRNADGFVAVETPTESIDGMAYGSIGDPLTFDWSGAASALPSSGQSLCRVDPTLDVDAAGDWHACPPSPGMTSDEGWEPPSPVAPGALVIVEVSANPPGPSSDEKYSEFIEIINVSEEQLELSACLVSDATSVEAPGTDPLTHLAGDGGCESATCLAPGRRALIVGNAYDGPSGDALVLAVDDSTIADGGLTNTEPVSIWNQDGELVTSYRHWPDPQGDPVPADGLSLHRLEPLAVDAPDTPEAWFADAPTPGV